MTVVNIMKSHYKTKLTKESLTNIIYTMYKVYFSFRFEGSSFYEFALYELQEAILNDLFADIKISKYMDVLEKIEKDIQNDDVTSSINLIRMHNIMSLMNSNIRQEYTDKVGRTNIKSMNNIFKTNKETITESTERPKPKGVDDIFRAYKEKTLDVKTNSTSIKIGKSNRNILDLSIVCKATQKVIMDWALGLKEETLTIDMNSYNDNMQKHIDELERTKKSIDVTADYIVLTPHGDFNFNATMDNINNMHIIDEDTQLSVDETVSKCSTIQAKRNETEEKILDYINLKTKEFDSFRKKIKFIANKGLEIHKQSGEHTLYLGVMFISGEISQKIKVNAPLIFIPININKVTNTEVAISIDSNRDVTFNKQLLLLLESNGIRVNKDLDETILNGILASGFDVIKEKIFNNSEVIGYNTYDKYSIDKIDIVDIGIRKLLLYNGAGLGIYNISTSIYDDFSKLEERKTNSIINRLLVGNTTETRNEKQYTQNPVYKTPDLKIISSLDSSQECAVYAASRTNGLVIYGPPGTGKSQVITNIVADYIAKGKRVLMVSEKQTALEVVYKRLKQLSKFAIMITDSGDTQAFRDKLEETEQEIVYQSVNKSKTLDTICNRIDDELNNLDSLEKELDTNVGNSGKTLSFLYQNSKNTDKSGEIALQLMVEHKSIVEVSYDELSSRIDKLNNSVYLKSYNIVKNGSVQSIIDMNELELHEFIGQLNKYKATLSINQSSLDEIKDTRENLSKYSTLFDSCQSILKENTIISSDSIDINIENADLDRLNSVLQEYLKFLLVKYDISTIEKLDENIDNIVAEQYKELYDSKKEIEVLINKYESLSLNPVLSTDLHIEYNKDMYIQVFELVSEYFNKLNSLDDLRQKGIKLYDNEAIKQYIKYKYNIDGTNIANVLNTYRNTGVSDILINITDEEYESYLKDIMQLQHKSNKLFRKFDKENQKNYSILISMYNKLNDKMNSAFCEILSKIQDINELAKSILQLCNMTVYTPNEDSINWIVRCIITGMKNKSLDIDIEISKNKDDTYNKLRNNIISRKNTAEYFNKTLNELLGTDDETAITLIINLSGKLNGLMGSTKSNLDNMEKSYSEVNELKSSIESKIHGGNIDDYIKNIDTLKEFEMYHDEVCDINSKDTLDKYILDLLCSGNEPSDIINAYCQYQISQCKTNVSNSIMMYDDTTKNVMSLESEKVDETINDIEYTNSSIVKEILSSSDISLNKILMDLRKKRKGKSIRQAVQEYAKLLIPMYRVWMMTPSSVSDVLPLEENMFDLVIFDEASQMYLYNALPSLYRAKRAVIAGDDKQLKPTSFFSTDVGSDEANDILDDTTGKDTSLLDQAKTTFSSITLTFHYRTKYAEIIQFSNYAFYNGRLKLAPNVIRRSKENRPIEFVRVPGIRENNANRIEAEKVVDILKNIMEHTNDTVGIVTLNSKQKDCIQDIIDDRCTTDAKFSTNINYISNRVEDNEDVSLFIKSIEEVQGDERDIIIISLGIGVNESGKVPLSQLGPILRDGGANRLNVMISRAKKKEYIVSSVDASDLNTSSSNSEGAKLLKEFIGYSKAISDLNYEAVEHILGCGNTSETHFDSPFEEQVYNQITKLGYTVETQVGVRGYKIDLAVYSDEFGQYIAGIECDGATYHSSKSARERDITRQRLLESRGWTILRIWSRNWWKDSSAEVHRIDSELQKIVEKLRNKPITEALERQRIEEQRKAELEVEKRKQLEIEERERLQKEKLAEMKEQQVEAVKETNEDGCLEIDLLSATESDVKGYKLSALIIDENVINATKWYEILEKVIQNIAKLDDVTYGDIQKNITKSKIIFINKNDCAKPKPLDENGEYFIDAKQAAYGFIIKAQKVLLQSTGNHSVKLRINQSTKYERKSTKAK